MEPLTGIVKEVNVLFFSQRTKEITPFEKPDRIEVWAILENNIEILIGKPNYNKSKMVSNQVKEVSEVYKKQFLNQKVEYDWKNYKIN